MKKVKHEKSATWIIINYHREIWKKCTDYRAQTDNEPSVHGPLYTGFYYYQSYNELSKFAVSLNIV